ncbi:MAG: hypothetical protein ACFFDR_05025 [Candidatus Thorarchaeota archaeon]
MGLSIAFVVLIIIFFGGGYASAANTQGLSWGISVGERIDYTLNTYSEGMESELFDNITVDCYVTIESLPEIPTIVTAIPILLPQYYNQSFSNGTEYSFPWIAVPIGNWTLISELLVPAISSVTNITIIDTPSDWGYEIDYESRSSNMTEILLISKSDGALNHIKLEVAAFVGMQYYRVEITRKGWFAPLDTLQTISIIITLASVGIIVVFGIMIIRNRSAASFS